MKRSLKNKILPWLAPVLGCLGMAAMWAVYAFGTDEKGLILPFHISALAVWAITAAMVGSLLFLLWNMEDTAGYRRLFDAAVAGDWAQAAAEQDRLARVFDIVDTPDPSRVSGGAAGLGAFKTALVELGIIGNNTMSTPMESLNAAEAAAIRAILAETGLLAAVAG